MTAAALFALLAFSVLSRNSTSASLLPTIPGLAQRFRQPAASCEFLRNAPTTIFWHSFPNPNDLRAWRSVFEDQLMTLATSPLARCDVPVYLGLPEGTPWPVPRDSAHSFIRNASRTQRSWAFGDKWEEEKTLAALHEFCAAPARSSSPSGAPHLVAYMHDKGTRVANETDPERFALQWDWRKQHEYYLLESPQDCIAALLDGPFDTCGSDFRDDPSYGPHYSGNFFWTTCDHVRRLPHPMDYCHRGKCRQPEDVQNLSPEFCEWPVVVGGELPTPFSVPLLSLGHPTPARAYLPWCAGLMSEGGMPLSCFDSHVNHYVSRVPRSLYAGLPCDSPRNVTGWGGDAVADGPTGAAPGDGGAATPPVAPPPAQRPSTRVSADVAREKLVKKHFGILPPAFQPGGLPHASAGGAHRRRWKPAAGAGQPGGG